MGSLLLSFGLYACTRERAIFTRSSFSVTRSLDLASLFSSSSLPARQLQQKAGKVSDIVHVHVVLARVSTRLGREREGVE